MSVEPPRLTTTDLQVRYDSVPILDGVSLHIPGGRITALIGANGCGKSTLLRTLARILTPDSGSVHLDGHPLQEHRRRDLARVLTILPQNPLAPEGLTVRELCRFGRDPHRRRGAGARRDDEAVVQTALSDAGLLDLADHLLETLSGGQRQRAWIAMALAQQTPVLLLDEPTTFLDIAHQMEVLRLLRRLNRDQGRTIVMVLHDLNQAARFADHLVALADGRVVATGPPAELLTEELVRSVFGVTCHIVANPLDGSPLCLPVD